MTTLTTLATVTRSARARVTGHWQVSLLTGLLFVVYGGYGLLRHATYLTAGYDLGIFDQAYARLMKTGN